MLSEPQTKRTVAFVDGQNLFYAAKKAFGYSFPNYDVLKLAHTVCNGKGWVPSQVRFYTGIPSPQDKPFWNHFWEKKLAVMGTQKIHVFSRPLRYRNQTVALPNGQAQTVLVGQEKGVDVRIALDLVRFAREEAYDVALVFSQDQDLTEAAEEIRLIAREQNRWVKVASAYPTSPTISNSRGINKTDWIPVDRHTYDSCLDPRDYRPKQSKS